MCVRRQPREADAGGVSGRFFLWEDDLVRGDRWAGLVSVVLVATACGHPSGGPQGDAPATSPIAEVVDRAASTPARQTITPAASPYRPGRASEFRPSGVSFIDESRGWVIGEGPCTGEGCSNVFQTRDGGRHWVPTSAPATGGHSRSHGGDPYVSDVRFADAQNGWAFDRDLWSTHDGGATWNPVPLDSPVLSLETTGGKVYALVASCHLRRSECRGPVRLHEAKVGGDDWRPVLTVDVGSARPNGQVVVWGRSVYVIVHPHFGEAAFPGDPPVLYAITPTGDPQRRRVPSPCGVRAVLAAAGPRDLSLWCQTGDGAGGSAPHVFYVSRNAGKTWTHIWKRRSIYYGPIAITPKGTFLGASIAWLQIERPDGTREMIRFSASGLYNEQIHRISFVTARQGWVVTGPLEGWLYNTRDAGHTWEPANFQS